MTVLERLEARSEWQVTDRSAQIGDCLVWTGASRDGYGLIWAYGKLVSAHRAAWIECRGSIPLQLLVLHHCDNRPCWNVDHLFLGTQADNIADRDVKGRNGQSLKTHCPQGHPYDEENTYRRIGKRYCRACIRQRNRERYVARKLAARQVA